MLVDGVYGLLIESRVADDISRAAGDVRDRSEGIAVLSRGRILGSDPHGGIFTGSYRYDAAEGHTLVRVHIAVPPHGVLLTGFEAGPDGAVVEVSARFPSANPVSSAIVELAGAPVAVELRYVGALSV